MTADGSPRVGRRSIAPGRSRSRSTARRSRRSSGDTIASAILANGIEAPFRSPILGRPRGVFSAGAEEPNAFVEISEPWFEPIVAATMVDVVDGMVVQSRPGVGRLRGDAPPGRPVEHRYTHVELLVVGSGHDGFYPARDAAARGERVMLVEQHRTIERGAGGDFRAEGVTYLTRATALGLYDDGYVTVLEHADELDRLWHVRAGRVILATGAFERSIAFADNDRPGVMLADASWLYLLEHGVLVGSRTVVFTARAAAYGAASNLVALGGDVPAIADVSGTEPDPGLARDAEVLRGWVVAGTEGDRRLEAVHLEGPDGDRRTIECDSLLVSGGWDPNLALWRAIGGGVRFDEEVRAFVPTEGPPWLSVVGSAAGEVRNDAPYWFVPSEDTSRHFVDFQRDQTIADIADAVDAGLRSVEHVKRATYIGTAIDQGRTSGVITAEVVNALLGESPGWQGPSNARPPTMPVPFATLAGPFRGALFDPIRSDADASVARRAWGRVRERRAVEAPVVLPARRRTDGARGRTRVPRGAHRGRRDGRVDARQDRGGGSRRAGVPRPHVHEPDVEPRGRLDPLRPDARAGRDGARRRRRDAPRGGPVPRDDHDGWRRHGARPVRGVAADRVAGPARVLHQRDRAVGRGRDQRASGARGRLGDGTDVDLSREAFPFMTFRDGQVAGVPARLARVSFSGELAYELHVPAWHGLEIWEAVMAAGAPFGIEPYGTEAMHVLRAEKGYVIVGQDTDGSVTPHDLGMDWIVNLSKGDFVGRRSLRRSDVVRPDRKQLVGLFPEDPHALLPEGAQLVLEDTGQIPMPLAGHVTSSYRSPALGRTFALAMLAGGHAMHGRTVYAPLPEGTVACTVTSPVPYDPDGARRDG